MQKNEYQEILGNLGDDTTLVAVSKMQTIESVKHLYKLGQRDFGENYVQELIEKQALLPNDIRWHFIGHLQSNKVKYVAPFIHLVQSVDSFKLLLEINRQAKKLERVIDCLLQVHIAAEETKFGLRDDELDELINGVLNANAANELVNVRVAGLMGMGSFSDDEIKVRLEFEFLSTLYDKYAGIKTPNFEFRHLSMGMSSDYRVALEEGSNMVRIGSLLFGNRNKN